MMTEHEYQFLTRRWRPEPDALQAVFNYCRNFGWCAGLDENQRPVLTKRGVKAFKAYRAENTT